MEYAQHIIEKANKYVAMGSPMTFEAICEMLAKAEARDAKKKGSRKEDTKAAQRARVEATKPGKLHFNGEVYDNMSDYNRARAEAYNRIR